ncbi:hypothetical protein SLS62_004824 [Diatrype stigma]|uniref:Major facilitator superfamily (MFS) profile domain-containing protein n=1 Tax=Diatrype stigma TaxID=117547 RepID=A0AAN9YTG0_9PEZI
MSDTKAPRSSPGQSPGASPVRFHGDSRSGERTPLLGTDTESRDFGAVAATTAAGADDGSRPAPISVNHHHHHNHNHHGGAAHEGFDPSSEADLYLARSFSSIPSGLAPEALESNMLRNRGPSPSGGSRSRSRNRRPSYSYEYERGERPAANLDSAISGGEDDFDFESGSGPGSEDSSSLSSGDTLDYGHEGGVDVANNNGADVDVEAGPLLNSPINGGGGRYGDDQGATNGAGKKSHHHHHHSQQQPQRVFLIDTDNRRFWLIFVGIMATYFLACFDGTIMASSHPVITSYFRSSNSASWLSTAFLLTNTAFQPMVGRLSDSLGRRGPYLVTMAIFGAATLWCALAQSMTSFIAARAVCGLGAGGMMALGNIIISDLVPIE